MVRTRHSTEIGVASDQDDIVSPPENRRQSARAAQKSYDAEASHEVYARPKRRRYSIPRDDDDMSHMAGPSQSGSHLQVNGKRTYHSPESDTLKSSTTGQYDQSTRRKSMRQRKETYCSLNESIILKTARCKTPPIYETEDRTQEDGDDGAECIYDVVKRHKRRSIADDMEEDTAPKSDDSDQSEGDEQDDESHKSYFLRQNKPVTKRYTAPPLTLGRARKKSETYFALTANYSRHGNIRKIPQHSSPYHNKRKLFGRPVKNGGSSTSSSDGSDDEQKFKRRKAKSMMRARNRCLPVNFKPDDIVGVLKDRGRARVRPTVGSSLADIDPMSIDAKVTFDSVGGLQSHVRSLKEMVVFPLIYPEVFEKFKIAPPRGVLFHGPPGTGKTLLARALANECSVGGNKVAFFMRKGADCLSKWVGESERQLRLLFDQAYTMRPSIIFFDEIDGLAPVRSTRQDQIHSSIVSTLLALMDGLDSRGEIVVIGATNRVDAIDPALRRPGRFDREFLFTLPNRTARQKILEIHTADWNPRLSRAFMCELAERCAGYCGADLKALCTETILCALRRRYPQIYKTNKKLLLDLNDINLTMIDFRRAIEAIVPASQRSIASPANAMPQHFRALLGDVLQSGIEMLQVIFPPSCPVKDGETATVMEDTSGDAHRVSIFEPQAVGRSTRSTQRLSSPLPEPPQDHTLMSLMYQPHHSQPVFRPRLLLTGCRGMGQRSHLAPALLYHMDHLTVQVLDLPYVFSMSSRTPEEACFQIFREARRTQPSVVFMPDIDVWWEAVPEATRATLLFLLNDMPPSCPVLVLATSSRPVSSLPQRLESLFSCNSKQVMTLRTPDKTSREEFFRDLFLKFAVEKQDNQLAKGKVDLEVLPIAPAPEPRQLSASEVRALREEEQNTLRELRLFLRHIGWKLLADRKFKEFARPVDLEEVPDYLTVVHHPMDLSTIMTRINSHCYGTCTEFLSDVDLITSNCLEYNPDREQTDRHLRNRACELRDTARALVYSELDPDFDKSCIEIQESRKKRGETAKGSAPPYLAVQPRPQEEHSPAKQPDIPVNQRSTRRSLKLRGEEAPEIPYIRNAIERELRVSMKRDMPPSQQEAKGNRCEETTPKDGLCQIDAEDATTDTPDAEGPDQTGTPCGEQETADDDVTTSLPTHSQAEAEQTGDREDVELQSTLVGLLEAIVKATDGHSIEHLEQTYNAICSVLFQHLRNSSKQCLCKELADLVDTLVPGCDADDLMVL